MKKYKDFKKAGNFTLESGRKVQGELSLNGASTLLKLYSDKPFDVLPNITGELYDLTKVSLIDCISVSTSLVRKGGNGYYHVSSVFPHFVVLGRRSLSSQKQVISEVSFTVDDAATLIHDFDAFGSYGTTRPVMERIIEEVGGNSGLNIGEHPHIFYYTGKQEIFAVDTVLGRVSVTYHISFKGPGPEGIFVENTIRINIAFEDDKDFDHTVNNVLDILRFFEVIAGRPQNVLDLVVSPSTEGQHTDFLDVYWCMPPHRGTDDELSKAYVFDLPIQAARNPNEFGSILKSWVERCDTWRDARVRYSTAIAFQRMYGVDRIVGAANMFDVMPPSACPAPTVLSSDLEFAKDIARKEFLRLPASPERDSVLSVLGRIGKASLKRKVRGRLKLITDVIGDKLPDFELVADLAVDCRNHYVHGTSVKIDINALNDQVAFFTNTLEFIFSASDLVESGWDIGAWSKQGATRTHPFGSYLVNYKNKLSDLKKLL